MATSPFDLRRLALGVLYVNLGRAAAEFPTTNVAHPSYTVYVQLVPPLGLLAPEHKRFFPFSVGWDIWQQVVVPLFAEGKVLLKVIAEQQSSGRNAINQEDYTSWLDQIEQRLWDQLQAAGFAPKDPTSVGFVATSTVPGAAQPVAAGTDDDSQYTRFDEGVLATYTRFDEDA